MARKKVKLAWIPNDAARRATFKKRRKGIVKKMSELSTLCGVQACAIIYGPHEVAPEVWPNPEDATVVLDRFRSMPETEQTKKMMNQERFLKDRILKTETQIARAEKENNEAECSALMFRCLAGGHSAVQNLDIGTIMSLAWMVEMKMKAVKERIESLEVEEQATATTAAATTSLALLPDVFPAAGVGLGGLIEYNLPTPFWPASDATSTGTIAPVVGDGGIGYLQFPRLDGSSNGSNLCNMNTSNNNGNNGGGGGGGGERSSGNTSSAITGLLGFNNPSWLEHYYHN